MARGNSVIKAKIEKNRKREGACNRFSEDASPRDALVHFGGKRTGYTNPWVKPKRKDYILNAVR